MDRTLRSLTARMATLAPAEQRVASYLVEHAQEASGLTVQEVAEAAGSSVATVVRVCKKAGFEGFQDFKLRLVRDLASPLASGYDAVYAGDDARAVTQKMFAAVIASLQETSRLASPDALLAAARRIQSAREVAVFGVGTSAYVALDAARRLMRAGVRVSAETSGVDQAVRAALLGPEDLVIAVSNSGRSSEPRRATGIAKDNGASVLVVTHAPHSPLAALGDQVLEVAAQESAFGTEAMAARLATLALLDAVFVLLALRQGETAAANLGRVTEVLEDL